MLIYMGEKGYRTLYFNTETKLYQVKDSLNHTMRAFRNENEARSQLNN